MTKDRIEVMMDIAVVLKIRVVGYFESNFTIGDMQEYGRQRVLGQMKEGNYIDGMQVISCEIEELQLGEKVSPKEDK